MSLAHNWTCATRRAALILSSAILIFVTCLTAQALTGPGSHSTRDPKARAAASKNRKVRRAKNNRLISRRGNPRVRNEEGRGERTDQPDEAMKQEFERRLPTGAK